MFSIFLIYLIGMLEKSSFYFLNKTNNFQNIQIMMTSFLVSMIFFTVSYVHYGSIDLSLLGDYRVYFSFILEVVSFKLSKFNYQNQKDYTSISFAQMTSVWLIFPIAYLLDGVLGYNETSMTINYTNDYQIYLYTVLFFISTIAYFYDKLNLDKIKYPFALFSLGISLTFTMYFAVKNLQTFQPTTVFGIVLLIISFIYLIEMLKMKTNSRNRIIRRSFKKNILMNYFKYFLSYLITISLSIYIILFMNVEFFTIFKRNGQMVAANIVDYSKTKKIPILKDIIVILSTLILALVIYF